MSKGINDGHIFWTRGCQGKHLSFTLSTYASISPCSLEGPNRCGVLAFSFFQQGRNKKDKFPINENRNMPWKVKSLHVGGLTSLLNSFS